MFLEGLQNIKGISYNSTTTKEGDVFVCIRGEKTDGHEYALNAQEKGAIAIVAERNLEGLSIPQIIVDDTKKALAEISSHFYGEPSKKMNIVGVTGTNGKTTVTHLVESIFEANGQSCGLIGTLGQRTSTKETYSDAKHTTPQAPELQKTLRTMLDNGIKNVVMEVSSHSLEQHRVGNVEFKGAVFTNLTQDHLDYHITMDNYFKSKAILFKNLKEDSWAVINLDDKYGKDFANSVEKGVKVLTYGINNNADIMAKDITFSAAGSGFVCKIFEIEKKINLKMTGLFSIYNVLAAISAAVAQGLDIDNSIKALEETNSVAGRFETVITDPLIIVDYAHTPDGLENVLSTAREIVPEGGELICIFGCGGDRDATKRPKMGAIAERIADKVIITSDNPRTEDPQQIITDILTGISSLNSEKIHVESDRHQAIEYAIKTAKNNDVVLIAGKGHEDYQILKNETIHFDDREEAKKAHKKYKS